MPAYAPKLPPKERETTYSEDIDAAFQREVDEEIRLHENRAKVGASVERHRISIADRSPYGPRSEHSFFQDTVAARRIGGDALARERLNRSTAAAEKQTRAVSSSVLTYLSSAVIEPYVQEAIAFGIRSTAPLSLALLRLDLPPSGTNVDWSKVTTATTFTAGSQSAENAALTASTDPVVGSATDPIRTLGGYIDFSAQSRDRSGGFFDRVLGEDLGRAFGARLESELWVGPGTGGRITGFTVMSGTSSSTVAGQTLANQTAKIWQQYQAVADNLGSLPDLISMASRRAGGLGSLTAALGLPFENVIPREPRENLVVSPAAPTILNSTEDWILIMNRASTPLVMQASPTIEYQPQGAGGTALNWKLILYAYVALGVSHRPEGVGLVKGLTAPSY